jgi:prevent-host-death family protein
MDILGVNIKDWTMKVMTARDAKNHFGEFLDAARREPVIVTKNDRPVAIMISIEDAADTLLPEMLLDKEPGYDGWLFEKVTSSIRRVDSGETALLEHDEAMEKLRKRLAERFGARTA